MISRTGVYGIAKDAGKILVVVQEKGPYKGRYDLPGGGIEFGETIEEALRREFLEEVGMEFAHMALFDNFSTVVEYFHQIGLIYTVSGLKKVQVEGMKHTWIEMGNLNEENTSPFLWKAL